MEALWDLNSAQSLQTEAAKMAVVDDCCFGESCRRRLLVSEVSEIAAPGLNYETTMVKPFLLVTMILLLFQVKNLKLRLLMA